MSEKKRTGNRREIHFREATAADRPRLIELVNSAFSVETFIDGTRTDEEHLAAVMAKGAVVVAEDGNGNMLACVCTEKHGARGYLGMLAVDPAQQGQGLGRKLMLETEERFRRQGCEAIDITVLSLRPELPPIYRRFGYVETRTEEFKPSRPLRPGTVCHCIVMSKILKACAEDR